MRKCSAAFYITLGFVYLWTTEASTGSCNCGRDHMKQWKNKCNNTEGVYDLTCYIKHKKKLVSFCEWKGDISTSYTLYTQQRRCSCVNVHQKNGIWTSDDFSVVKNCNVTAHVIASSGNQHWCTYKNFSGIPSEITLCGPHSKLTYKRSSGHLIVQVEWGDESKHIKNFFVEYKVFNTTSWKEQQSKNNNECVLWNLTTSLPYELRIRCAPTKECMQCPRSEVILVPPELTDAPSIQLEIQDHIQNHFISPGQRKAVVKWQYANSEAVDYYNVTVRKVSGEHSNQDSFRTEDSSLTLILSYSSYNISIAALNTAGSSPVSYIATEQMDEWRDSFGPFSVNITSNNSVSLSWNSPVSSVCFSVEWWARGQIPTFCPFYEKQTHKEIAGKTDSFFQPYTRYYFVLHTRPYTDTCNIKNVNNSETTYGTAQAYFTEGSPIGAPGNLSILNITQHSSVITWRPVSEEDLRGFLLGYYIYLKWDNNETSFTVDPSINSYELQNLESNTAYRVQLSAFTVAGEGQRSNFRHFDTNKLESTALDSIIAAIIVGIIILLLAVNLSFRLLHRVKKLLWPSIPNPENSNAVQKIEIAYELQGILEPLNRQRLEESEGCDSSTVCVVRRKREASPLCSPPTALSGLHTTLLFSEDEDSPFIPEQVIPPDPTNEPDSTDTFPIDFNKTDSTLNTSVDEEISTFESIDPGETISNTTGSDFLSASRPAVVFMSDYTTMEIFQQVTMAGIQSPTVQTVKPGLVLVHPGQDYVRQSYFSQETVQ